MNCVPSPRSGRTSASRRLAGFAAACVLLFSIPGCGGDEAGEQTANQKKGPANAQGQMKKGGKKGGMKGPGGRPGGPSQGQATAVAVEVVRRAPIASYAPDTGYAFSDDP